MSEVSEAIQAKCLAFGDRIIKLNDYLLKEAANKKPTYKMKHMRFTVIDFIQRVQTAVERGDVNNLGSLKANGNVDYPTFSQILECREGDFTINADKQFECKLYLKAGMLGVEKLVEFTDKTTARDFQL